MSERACAQGSPFSPGPSGAQRGQTSRALSPGGDETSTSRGGGEAPLIVPYSPPPPLPARFTRAPPAKQSAGGPDLAIQEDNGSHPKSPPQERLPPPLPTTTTQNPLFPAGAGAPGFQKPALGRRTHPPQSEQPRPPAAAATGPRAGGEKENLQQRPGASTHRLLLASRLGRREGRRPGGRLSTRERRPLPERKESAWVARPGGDRAPGNARWALGCRPQSPGIRGEFSGDQREPAASRRRRKKEAGSVRGAPGGGSSNAPSEPADAWRLHWVSAAPPPRRAEQSRAEQPCRAASSRAARAVCAWQSSAAGL